jgi:adenylate cyclase
MIYDRVEDRHWPAGPEGVSNPIKPMRRYWLISLAVGGGAAALVLALVLGGIFEPLVARLADFYEACGWSIGGNWIRLRWLEFGVVVISALGIALAVIEITKWIGKVLTTISTILLLLVLSPVFALYGILFDPAGPLTAALLAAGGAFLFARTPVGKRKRLLEEAIGSRVSVRIFNDLLESPDDPGFAGASRRVSTLVCLLFPPEIGELGNGAAERLKMGSLFLRSVSTFLLARGAYLEEAGPERVRVSFGMLQETPDHAEQACRAALDLRIRLKGLAQEFESRWFQPLHCGIGIESGEMTVGLCGTPDQFFFAGLGGGEDFAGRLAFANRRFGSDLLVGPETYRLVRDRFEVRPMEMIYDPAACRLHEIFQLLAVTGQFSPEERERRDHFWRGVVFLRENRGEEALEAFSRARVPGGEDGPLSYFVAKAQDGVALPESRPLRLVRELTEEGHARLIEKF